MAEEKDIIENGANEITEAELAEVSGGFCWDPTAVVVEDPTR